MYRTMDNDELALRAYGTAVGDLLALWRNDSDAEIVWILGVAGSDGEALVMPDRS